MPEAQANVFIPNRREALIGQLDSERQHWLGARAVADRSDRLDGQAVREEQQRMANLNALLDRFPAGYPRATQHLITERVAA